MSRVSNPKAVLARSTLVNSAWKGVDIAKVSDEKNKEFGKLIENLRFIC
jgi:hypothetical protein